MAKTVEDYVNKINESNLPDKEELVKLVQERGKIINRSGKDGVEQFLRIEENVLDRPSGNAQRLETARKVSAALGGEEVQAKIGGDKIHVKASAEEIAGVSGKERSAASTPEKPSTSPHVEGKQAAAVTEEVGEKVAKKGLKKALGKIPVVGAFIGMAATAEEFLGKTSQAMASDDLSRMDKAVVGVTNAVGGVASFVPGAGDAAQHLLNKGAEHIVGEGAKKHLMEDGITLANQGAEIARAESSAKAEKAANGTKLSAAMEKAMQQASDAGCKVPGNCIEVNHDLKQPVQVASSGQSPKELGGRH